MAGGGIESSVKERFGGSLFFFFFFNVSMGFRWTYARVFFFFFFFTTVDNNNSKWANINNANGLRRRGKGGVGRRKGSVLLRKTMGVYGIGVRDVSLPASSASLALK